MTNKEVVNKQLVKRIKSQHLIGDVVKIVEGFFESIDYETDAMTFDQYAKFVHDKGCLFRHSFIAFTVIRSILNYSFDILWDFDHAYELFDVCDLRKEAKCFITKSEWDEFVETGLDELCSRIGSNCIDYFVSLAFVWNGIMPRDIKTIRKKDIVGGVVQSVEVGEDIIALIKGRLETLSPESVVYSRRPVMRENFKRTCPKTFSYRIVDARINDVYMSGVVYRISKGYEVEMANPILGEYYKKISEIIYG